MSLKPRSKMAPEVAFGTAVREIRNRRGLSQEQLGFESDLHRTFISDIERGARNPTIKTVWKLSKALGIRPSEFFKIAEADFDW